MISDKKSIGNEVVFSETLPRTGSERCTRLFPVPLQNCSAIGHLWTSSEVFGKLRICLCHLRISWYSPVKNLTPLTQTKLAGIQCHCNTVIGKSHFGLKRGALLVSGMVGVTLWWTRASGLGIQVGIEILQQVTSCCQNHKRSEKHIFDGPLGFQQRLSPFKFTTLLTNYFSRAFLHDCICTR